MPFPSTQNYSATNPLSVVNDVMHHYHNVCTRENTASRTLNKNDSRYAFAIDSKITRRLNDPPEYILYWLTVLITMESVYLATVNDYKRIEIHEVISFPTFMT